jgi:hypothetical protein
MKTALVFLLMLAAVTNSNGQLLKKLKEKAAKVMEPKKTAGDTGSSSTPVAEQQKNKVVQKPKHPLPRPQMAR